MQTVITGKRTAAQCISACLQYYKYTRTQFYTYVHIYNHNNKFKYTLFIYIYPTLSAYSYSFIIQQWRAPSIMVYAVGCKPFFMYHKVSLRHTFEYNGPFLRSCCALLHKLLLLRQTRLLHDVYMMVKLLRYPRDRHKQSLFSHIPSETSHAEVHNIIQNL